MPIVDTFYDDSTSQLSESFLEKGFVITPCENREGLDAIRDSIVGNACSRLGLSTPDDKEDFLNNIQNHLSLETLNEFRLALYFALNNEAWLRPTYFSLVRSTLEELVGNELAMQNRVNLSINMPNDNSSLVTLHSDSFGGDSPFQVVVWIPLVGVEGNKSVYVLPPEKNREVVPRLSEYGDNGGMAAIFEEIKDEVIYAELKYGEALIFTPNILHGADVNTSEHTRWSMNVRFKGLFTPYTSYEKQIGNYYLPITARVVSQVGMDHIHPEKFEGHD